jgi:hypothetical protein
MATTQAILNAQDLSHLLEGLTEAHLISSQEEPDSCHVWNTLWGLFPSAESLSPVWMWMLGGVWESRGEHLRAQLAREQPP